MESKSSYWSTDDLDDLNWRDAYINKTDQINACDVQMSQL